MSYAIKTLGSSGRIAGYGVLFGNPQQTDLSPMKDFFTKRTDFYLGALADGSGNIRLPMIYDHGTDPATCENPVIGYWTKAVVNDTGLWLEGQVNMAHKYAAAVMDMIKRGLLACSSDAIAHLVKRVRQPNGSNEIKVWALGGVSLTPSPAEPRLVPVAAFKSMGITLPQAFKAGRRNAASDQQMLDAALAQAEDLCELLTALGATPVDEATEAPDMADQLIEGKRTMQRAARITRELDVLMEDKLWAELDDIETAVRIERELDELEAGL